ncbi:MAG: DUF503 domain-containing protein [Clostridia bacterium]|nr:DUF503 domain-containing protein [Clostridia bacterium]
MVVGLARVELAISSAGCLKAKRRVVKSLVDRIRRRFNVSVAEVDQQGIWQRATLGIACVSNEASHADSILSRVVAYIGNDREAELLDYSTEIM